MSQSTAFPELVSSLGDRARKLWEVALGAEDIFKRDEVTAMFPENTRLAALDPNTLDGAGASPSSHEYLPIEYLRWFPLETAPKDRERRFLSSGTTGSQRSQSFFSKDGLTLYKLASLTSFFAVLQDFFPEPRKVDGISLIPSLTEWPDSSLAQMVAWIREFAPVQYAGANDFAPTARGLRRPIWIFGTAVHFVTLFDKGVKISLPEGSVVVETGGMKGAKRSVSNSELLAMIEHALGVTPERVISEYGMCELASQAYAWKKPGELNRATRTYRFPRWVKTAALGSLDRVRSSGMGALLVNDPLRIDYPLPLRTQDLVTITESGFTLEGRVPRAVLKGCSLNVPFAESPQEKTSAFPQTVPPSTSKSARPDRVQPLNAALTKLIRAADAQEILAKELSSRQLAVAALKDLESSLPRTSEEWMRAAERSLGQDRKCADEWLFILPGSHAFAGIYPLALGYLLDLTMTVRRTSLENEFESLVLSTFTELPDAKLRQLPPSFRIGTDLLPEQCEAILAFGSNETIEQLQSLTRKPIKAFGSALAVTVLDSRTLTPEVLQAAVKDCFSLAQRGCMATRLIVLEGNVDMTAFQQECVNITRKLIAPLLSTPEAIALDHEWLEQKVRRNGVLIKRERENDPVFPCFRHVSELASIVSERPYIVPTIQTESLAEFMPRLFKAIPEINRITTNISVEALQDLLPASVTCVGVGDGNCPLWDGTHQGQPLFGFSGRHYE